MELLPIALNVRGRRALVVGGGAVARRKVEALVEAGADVTIVAPEITFPTEPLQVRLRPFQSGDEAGFSLVFAATDNPAVNREVVQLAHAAGAWCNDASDPESSDFHTASVFRCGSIAVGVTTGGESPVLAAHLRRRIEAAVGAEYEVLVEIAGALEVPLEKRGEFWRGAVAEEILEALRTGNRAEAEQKLRELLGP